MSLIHWLETQTNTETLQEIDKRIQNNQYRIVQCCNHEWYLLTKNKWWFGYTPTSGRDRGATGYYNYQLNEASNALYHLIYTIPEIIKHNNKYTPWHRPKEKLPKITAELDIKTAWNTLTNEIQNKPTYTHLAKQITTPYHIQQP